MRASDLKPGQRFTLPRDPHDVAHVLTKLESDDGCFAVNAENQLVKVHPDSAIEIANTTAGGGLRFTITHHENDHTLSGRIEVGSHGLDIFFDGYGQHTMEPGFGAPLFIEPDDNGHPVVYCWSEIDSEDHTHKISLQSARDNREPTLV